MVQDEASQWLGGFENSDLLKELLDDESLFLTPETEDAANRHRSSRENSVNRLISTLYSGPRIEDVENALSFMSPRNQHVQTVEAPPSRETMGDRNLSKMEPKYSLKIRNYGNGLGDDGYKWRKYGQKSIKNSPNPRSYYKCSNPRCNAKKQVERSMEDPETFLITYEGLHLHFTYPFFSQPEAQTQTKRPKKTHIKSPSKAQDTAHQAQESSLTNFRQSEGLLEDVVAPVIRNVPPAGEIFRSGSSPCSSNRSGSSSGSQSDKSWTYEWPSSSCFHADFSDVIR